MFDNVLFDLDGTLTDSFEGITNSVIYALKALGAKCPDKKNLSVFIGPPLFESFQKQCGFDEQTASRALELYRVYYSENGWKENRVYDGVEQTLKALKDAGKTLGVATSKPEHFSGRIITHFGLDKYFAYIAGASFDSSRATKDKVIAYALDSMNIDAKNTVMVGDRHHDIDGAKANGLRSIGVLYGYGDEQELKKAGADFIAQTPNEIIKYVC